MLSIFSVHPALRGLASVRFPPSPITWLRLLAWTHKRPSPAIPVCLGVFGCFSFVFFRVRWINLAPLGPSLLTPTTAWQNPPSSTIFLLHVMSSSRIFTRFRLPSTYLGFIPDYVRLPLWGPGFRKHVSCTPPLQPLLPVFVQRLTPEASNPHFEEWGRSIAYFSFVFLSSRIFDLLF